MEQQLTTTRTGIKWGIISGITGIVMLLVMYLTDLWKNPWAGGLGMLVGVIFYVLAMKEYKASNNGYLTIGEGVGIGLILAVISALFGQAFDQLYKRVIDTTLIQRTLEFQEEKFIEAGMSDAMIDDMTKRTMEWNDSGLTLVISVIGALAIGLIISLIVAAIMQKKKPVF